VGVPLDSVVSDRVSGSERMVTERDTGVGSEGPGTPAFVQNSGRRKREPLPVRSIHAGCPATRPVNLFALGQILRRQTNA
jgi:hypothetical protein